MPWRLERSQIEGVAVNVSPRISSIYVIRAGLISHMDGSRGKSLGCKQDDAVIRSLSTEATRP